ncbi:TetR family transcriptional regulator [Corynebacterium sanguinis]|uniref:TetR/AcrR family transcriptional regulator n=1 Tax=Corynebacterium sanguinis TaxID=2594913 RepID=UPI00119CE453|nr:TetR/AcrR family transcriptional regulator [Corynebacterium sanguinis]TVS22181.1 TetR family transcriptional regulator [Corynebacterium sanguinis]
MTKPPCLRERKRQATLRRIYDEALALVERHGADAVTVEDICAAADISRRTFFNYVSSKDDAILGAFPFELDAEALAAIEATQSDNLIELIVSQMKERPELVSRGLLERRRLVISDNPPPWPTRATNAASRCSRRWLGPSTSILRDSPTTAGCPTSPSKSRSTLSSRCAAVRCRCTCPTRTSPPTQARPSTECGAQRASTPRTTRS